MRRVLMISEKFPPFNASGSHRPFHFAKYLPEYGYVPWVLASRPASGDVCDAEPLAALSPDVEVWRTPRLLHPLVAQARALRRKASSLAEKNAAGGARSKRPRLLDWLENLNWWAYWELDWAAIAALSGWLGSLLHPPDLIWATGPPFRGYALAARLAAQLDKPLVLDVRDPWTYGSLWSPATADIDSAERRWARRVFERAQRIVLTSPLTEQSMRQRFPGIPGERWLTLTNGYDDAAVEPERLVPKDQCLFRYVGTLNERRKPDVLIRAFARAAEDPAFRSSAVLEFIGSAGTQAQKAALAPDCSIAFRGAVSRADSLRFIFGSDVNVLLQTINEGADVISGKAFDYLNAKKPIVAVVDPAGGDAWLMHETGAGSVAPWSDVDAIASELTRAWRAWRGGEPSLSATGTEAYSRRALTGRLAAVFDEILAQKVKVP